MPIIKTSKGDFRFKPQVVYLGIKQIDRDVAFSNLQDVSAILNKANILWGPVFGSLLGIVRENNFIEWDEDIDLYVLEKDRERFLPLLFEFQDAGFAVIRDWRSGVLSIKRNGEYIDFYFARNIGDGVYSLTGEDYILEKYLLDVVKWDFNGIELYIPREKELCLELQYGDWRTPVKYADFNMGLFRRVIMVSRLFVINSLPDFLYYPLFRIYHRKDLEKFKSKCALHGIRLSRNVTLNNYKRF